MYIGLSIKRIPLGGGHNCLPFCFQVVPSRSKTLIGQLSSGIDFGGFFRGRLGICVFLFVCLEELSILEQSLILFFVPS